MHAYLTARGASFWKEYFMPANHVKIFTDFFCTYVEAMRIIRGHNFGHNILNIVAKSSRECKYLGLQVCFLTGVRYVLALFNIFFLFIKIEN